MPPADGGHNLENADTCRLGAGANTDPELGPLANNGGQTDTMRLLAGSPAINRGAGCEATDQRGVPRSLGGVCDSPGRDRQRQ